MKKREYLIANGLIILGVIIYCAITFGIFSKLSPRDILNQRIEQIIVGNKSSETKELTCSNKEKLPIESDDKHLQALIEYQERCGSFATDTLMFFTDFPYDLTSADEKSTLVARKLNEFSSNRIKPLVIIEPYVGDKEMEYRDFLNGKYDVSLEQYFALLKSKGVTESMMGTWVPFPESNTPNWANKDTEPNDFSLVVNKYLRIMKKYFPQAEASILLSAITYEPTDINWENGDYISLDPYTSNLDRNLINSIGIQGFPWVPSATKSKIPSILRATEFLQPDIAISAAQELRTRDIWINTGSFYAKYTTDPSERVFLTLSDRKAILEGILEVANYIKSYQLNEYRVKINLFSEDKSEYIEATDWSYFQDQDSVNLLKEFLSAAEESSIQVSLFDQIQ